MPEASSSRRCWQTFFRRYLILVSLTSARPRPSTSRHPPSRGRDRTKLSQCRGSHCPSDGKNDLAFGPISCSNDTHQEVFSETCHSNGFVVTEKGEDRAMAIKEFHNMYGNWNIRPDGLDAHESQSLQMCNSRRRSGDLLHPHRPRHMRRGHDTADNRALGGVFSAKPYAWLFKLADKTTATVYPFSRILIS